MRRAVHLAGRGAVSAYGNGVEALVEGVLSGRRAVRPRARTTSFTAPTRVAGEFPAGSFPADVREAELSYHAGLRAAREALEEAGIEDAAELGLILATTKAELTGVTDEGDGFGLPARLAARLARGLGLRGSIASISTACASGASALAMAERRIAAGELERVLVVGADALNEFIMAGFGSMHILDPEPCRPFDLARRGISLGDGAGAMLLTAHESESIGFRLAGHGAANDACSVTGCHREGLGVKLAVTRALEHAGVAREEIDLVHLHGTGTKANDFSEAIGLGRVFDGPTPPAFGTKGQTGHTLGAAGVLETLIALGALERGFVPANSGLEEPNVDPRLSLTREPETLARNRAVLKVAGGFGGIQQAVVLTSTRRVKRRRDAAPPQPAAADALRVLGARSSTARRDPAARELATPSARILAIGAVDAHSIAGSGGLDSTWKSLGSPPLGGTKLYRELFGRNDDTFRRLDRQTRAIVLATAATGVDALLGAEEREATALVAETVWGSIEVDFKYTRSLAAEMVHGAIFPYTLQSTCLGDVALRNELRGPTISLSVGPQERGEALREALRLFRSGELRHALVGSVDALASGVPGEEPVLRAVVALVAAPGASPGVRAVADWPGDGADPFAALLRSLRRPFP